MSHKALGVHYDTTLDEAKAEFAKRGYEGIGTIEYYDRYGTRISCNEARHRASSDASIDGSEFCYEYEGVEFIDVGNCRIYAFTFERYTGPPGDGVHKKNCRNCGR